MAIVILLAKYVSFSFKIVSIISFFSVNPVSIALNVECSKDKTEYCIEGDLSAKHGKLKSNEGGKAKTKFSDNVIKFFSK